MANEEQIGDGDERYRCVNNTTLKLIDDEHRSQKVDEVIPEKEITISGLRDQKWKDNKRKMKRG